MALVYSTFSINLYLYCRLEHYTGECRTNLHLEFGKAKIHCSLKSQQIKSKISLYSFVSAWMAVTGIQSRADYYRQYILCRVWGIPGGRFATFLAFQQKKTLSFINRFNSLHPLHRKGNFGWYKLLSIFQYCFYFQWKVFIPFLVLQVVWIHNLITFPWKTWDIRFGVRIKTNTLLSLHCKSSVPPWCFS